MKFLSLFQNSQVTKHEGKRVDEFSPLLLPWQHLWFCEWMTTSHLQTVLLAKFQESTAGCSAPCSEAQRITWAPPGRAMPLAGPPSRRPLCVHSRGLKPLPSSLGQLTRQLPCGSPKLFLPGPLTLVIPLDHPWVTHGAGCDLIIRPTHLWGAVEAHPLHLSWCRPGKVLSPGWGAMRGPPGPNLCAAHSPIFFFSRLFI